MRAALSVGGIAALAFVAFAACKSTQGDATATKTEAIAPVASAVAASDVDAAPAAVRQTARFHLVASAKGRPRRFAPGVSIQRIDADGGAAAVTLDPPGDDTSNGALVTATPLTPGHYRAHFLVAVCSAGSPDGGCTAVTPKPDDAEFDVPASGDVDVDVK